MKLSVSDRDQRHDVGGERHVHRRGRPLLIKGFEDKNNRVFGAGDMIDYGGVAFVRQDAPCRCNLPDAGGVVQTRCNTGKVRVAHLFGANAFGYLDLGEAV